MARLDELKQKYSSAIEAMSQQGVQVSQVAMKGDKLLIQGAAPTAEAKNAVWDKIKAVDSSYSDLECDITVGARPAGGVEGASLQSLAGGLSQAFRSDQTPAFPQMLSSLFNNSDGQQRAGLLNQLLAAAGPSILGSALPGPLAGLLKGGGQITPEQAQQIPAESVQEIAAHAEKANPSIIDQVSGFYSQHPQVVQALGAGALALIMSHISKKD
jgi:hypothetical protein